MEGDRERVLTGSSSSCDGVVPSLSGHGLADVWAIAAYVISRYGVGPCIERYFRDVEKVDFASRRVRTLRDRPVRWGLPPATEKASQSTGSAGTSAAWLTSHRVERIRDLTAG